MSVIIKNLTRVTQVQGKRLRNDVRLLRRICAIERFDLGIACIDNSTMRNLNSQFRFKDKTTDILSFPFLEVRSYRPGIHRRCPIKNIQLSSNPVNNIIYNYIIVIYILVCLLALGGSPSSCSLARLLVAAV